MQFFFIFIATVILGLSASAQDNISNDSEFYINPSINRDSLILTNVLEELNNRNDTLVNCISIISNKGQLENCESILEEFCLKNNIVLLIFRNTSNNSLIKRFDSPEDYNKELHAIEITYDIDNLTAILEYIGLEMESFGFITTYPTKTPVEYFTFYEKLEFISISEEKYESIVSKNELFLSHKSRAKIFQQILEQTDFEVDRSATYFLASHSHGISEFLEDDFFIQFIAKNGLQITKNNHFSEKGIIGISLILDLANSTLEITTHSNGQDSSNDLPWYIITPEIFHYRIDSNNNLIRKPSKSFYTSIEKELILKQILQKLDGKLTPCYFDFYSPDVDFTDFKIEQFVEDFKLKNNFEEKVNCFSLVISFDHNFTLIKTYGVITSEELLTGEITYTYKTDSYFYFRRDSGLSIIEITKEEYEKLYSR